MPNDNFDKKSVLSFKPFHTFFVKTEKTHNIIINFINN